MIVEIYFIRLHDADSVNIMGKQKTRTDLADKYIGRISQVLSGPCKPKSQVKWFRDLGQERKKRICKAYSIWHRLHSLAVDTDGMTWRIDEP